MSNTVASNFSGWMISAVALFIIATTGVLFYLIQKTKRNMDHVAQILEGEIAESFLENNYIKLPKYSTEMRLFFYHRNQNSSPDTKIK